MKHRHIHYTRPIQSNQTLYVSFYTDNPKSVASWDGLLEDVKWQTPNSKVKVRLVSEGTNRQITDVVEAYAILQQIRNQYDENKAFISRQAEIAPYPDREYERVRFSKIQEARSIMQEQKVLVYLYGNLKGKICTIDDGLLEKRSIPEYHPRPSAPPLEEVNDLPPSYSSVWKESNHQ